MNNYLKRGINVSSYFEKSVYNLSEKFWFKGIMYIGMAYLFNELACIVPLKILYAIHSFMGLAFLFFLGFFKNSMFKFVSFIFIVYTYIYILITLCSEKNESFKKFWDFIYIINIFYYNSEIFHILCIFWNESNAYFFFQKLCNFFSYTYGIKFSI